MLSKDSILIGGIVMKRILSLFLIIMMMTFSSNSSALEQNEKEATSKYLSVHIAKVKSITGLYKDDIEIKKLTDNSGNEFELIETGKSGYYIFDPYSGRYLEYSKDAPSPYLGKSGELKYFGPKCYFNANDGKYAHTINSNAKELNKKELSVMQNNFDQMIGESRKTKDNNVLSFIKENRVFSILKFR